MDAVVLPTAPFHPTFREVAADPVGVNAALGRFTSGANLLDWCAAAIPAPGAAPDRPVGLSVLGPAWTDREVWALGARLAGMEPPPCVLPPVRLAVCGAHLEGQPLHHQLVDRRATLVARGHTAPVYRMVVLPTEPPKPGVVRVRERGASLEVEVYALDHHSFGSFVDTVPAPLTIGTVELADGTSVHGFLCESLAVDGAPDITEHGGWRAWLAR